MKLLFKLSTCVALILAAALCALFILQHDVQFRTAVAHSVAHYCAQSLACECAIDDVKLDLAQRTITLKNISMRSADKTWSWQAATATCSWSWLALLRTGVLSCRLFCDQLKVESAYNLHANEFAIQPHIAALLVSRSPIPIELTHIKLSQCSSTFFYQDKAAHAEFSLQGRLDRTKLHARVQVDHIQARTADSYSLITQANCTLLYDGDKQQATLEGAGKIPLLTCEQCFLKARQDNRGYMLDIVTQDETYKATITVHNEQVDLHMQHAALGVQLKACYHDNILTGSLSKDEQNLDILCLLDKKTVQLSHSGYMVRGHYDDQAGLIYTVTYNDKKIGAGTLNKQGTLCCAVDYTVLSLLAPDWYVEVPHKETVRVTGSYQNDKVNLEIAADALHMRVPGISNIIKSLQLHACVHPQEQFIEILDSTITMHHGRIHITRGTLQFENYVLKTVSVPLLMQSAFVGFEKDFFALLSASLCYQYADGHSSGEGYCLIERCQIRDNLLSHKVQKSLIQPPQKLLEMLKKCALNVWVLSERDAKIQASMLDANARVTLHIGGTLYEPTLKGTVELVQGQFNFPYKPLYISHAHLYFSPFDSTNPQLDIFAKNSIKKYHIGMTITGSVQNPTINFSSTPALEREQIVTLLLGGVENGALFIALPKPLGETLEELVLGSSEDSDSLLSHLSYYLRPLRGMRLVPSLSDQKGRGGLRGSLIVEVNDRLRALYQQNFSLSEDTRWEIEYDLSDDMSVRAIRDERGDVGAEVEMRWKL